MSRPCAVGAGGMPRRGLCAAFVRHHDPLWAWRLRRSQPAHRTFVSAAAACRPGCSGGGGFFVSSPPPSVLPRSARSRGGHSGGFVPPGQLSHSRGVVDLWQLDSPAHYLAGPLWVFRHSGGLTSPLLVPHSGGLVGHFGGFAAPIVAPDSQGFAGTFSLPTSFSTPLHWPCPMAAPLS